MSEIFDYYFKKEIDITQNREEINRKIQAIPSVNKKMRVTIYTAKMNWIQSIWCRTFFQTRLKNNISLLKLLSKKRNNHRTDLFHPFWIHA